MPALKNTSKFAIFLMILTLFTSCGGGDSDNDMVSESGSEEAIESSGTSSFQSDDSSSFLDSIVDELPDVDTFVENPSDQFLVDMEHVTAGSPYMGENSDDPHTGAHIYFRNDEGQYGPEPESYPPIYAMADGYVSRVDTYFGEDGSNKRYGLGLAFAQDGGEVVDMHYSIEPMIDPDDETAYESFLLVEEGDYVEKGDIIAYMYVPEEATHTHIHFNLIHPDLGFQSPSVFDVDVEESFFEAVGGLPFLDEAEEESCFGYELSADENPFDALAVEFL